MVCWPALAPMTRVLIVDDYVGIAESLSRLLTDFYAVEVDLAHSHAEGLEHYAPGRCELVISDGDLGDGRGEDLIAQIRAQGQAPRCILISGGFRRGEPAELEAQGVADRVLMKDVDASQQIVAEVEALVEAAN